MTDGCGIKTLAYLGDAVFELCVRNFAVRRADARVGEINKCAKAYSRAAAQEKMHRRILPHLTDDEKKIIKKGRNLSGKRFFKTCGARAYRYATGLEALFGYLYVNGQTERIDEIFKLCVECAEPESDILP